MSIAIAQPAWQRRLFASFSTRMRDPADGKRLRDPADGKQWRSDATHNTCCCEPADVCCDTSIVGVGPNFAHIAVTGTSSCLGGCYSNISSTGAPNDTFTATRTNFNNSCRYVLDAPYTSAQIRSHFPAPDCSQPTTFLCSGPVTCATDRIHVELEMGYLVGSPTLWRVYGLLYNHACACCAGGPDAPYSIDLPVFNADGFGMGKCVGDGTTVSNSGTCVVDENFTFGCDDNVGYPDFSITAYTGGTIVIALSNTP